MTNNNIVNNKDLNMSEKLLLIMIKDNIKTHKIKDNVVTLTNKQLSILCGCSERKITDVIAGLIDKKILEVVKFDGKRRYLKLNIE